MIVNIHLDNLDKIKYIYCSKLLIYSLLLLNKYYYEYDKNEKLLQFFN
jgi:hypothetical protein